MAWGCSQLGWFLMHCDCNLVLNNNCFWLCLYIVLLSWFIFNTPFSECYQVKLPKKVLFQDLRDTWTYQRKFYFRICEVQRCELDQCQVSPGEVLPNLGECDSMLGQGPLFPQNWVPFLSPFLNFWYELMLFFNIASVLRLFRIFDRQFLQFSGLVGQTVSEYLRLGDRQFQIF